MRLICLLLQAYLIVIFARIILSWFPVQPGSGMASVSGFLFTITEPVLGPVRRLVPTMGMFDLSPLIVTFAIFLLMGAIC